MSCWTGSRVTTQHTYRPASQQDGKDVSSWEITVADAKVCACLCVRVCARAQTQGNVAAGQRLQSKLLF